MFLNDPPAEFTLIERIRLGWRRRAVGIVVALGFELLLVLALWKLGVVQHQKKPDSANLVSISIAAPKAEKQAPNPPQHDAAAPDQAVQHSPLTQQDPAPVQPTPRPAQPSQPAFIQMDRNQMASLDISRIPRQAAPATGRGMMGPPDLGVPGDSKRVGTTPGGQPMYAASWYREPYDSELSGYLSTAQGPGWALITCRTAPDFRVEDCVGLDEYPSGSQIQRAVLAAAWQFKVRPSRVGGISQVGAWVRIRIDYTERRH